MMKNEVRKAAETANNINSALERKVLDAETIQRKVQKCSDYNDSRHDARNFKSLEFAGQTFVDEDLSGIEIHHSKFTNCCFLNTKMDRIEAYFAVFENCVFENCSIENANFSFATLNVRFKNCNLNGADFPFANGKIEAEASMMERCTAQNSKLQIALSNVNAYGFAANFADIQLNAAESNLRRAEFNDGKLSGKIKQTDLTVAEMNRSDLTDLELVDCAIRNLETEDAIGFDSAEGDDAFENIFEDEE